jgi:hypothetical protein
MMNVQAKLDNALTEYASENGDGFYSRDWVGAYEYQDDGFALAERAVALAIPGEDRDDWIEEQCEAFPQSARYLIAIAADYRFAEMAEEAKSPARTEWLEIAADITGAGK